MRIDVILETEQRDKLVRKLGLIDKLLHNIEEVLSLKFVPMEEGEFDSQLGMLETTRLCLSAVDKFVKGCIEEVL